MQILFTDRALLTITCITIKYKAHGSDFMGEK